MADITRLSVISVNLLILAACVLPAACGKRSERPEIDQEMAERLYLACITQAAASPFACRTNAEDLAEKRKP